MIHKLSVVTFLLYATSFLKKDLVDDLTRSSAIIREILFRERSRVPSIDKAIDLSSGNILGYRDDL